MQFASRLSRLGTETAFAVSAEANRYRDSGKRVYPFHLGDLNIPTPPHIVEAALRAARDGKTGYCPPAGVPELRQAVAEDINRSHGARYGMANVVIEPGGKPVIGKFILAMMNPGDEVLYPNPGYPIYPSQIEFHGGRAVPYTYHEGAEQFEIDVDEIAAAITPKTRLLILNDHHNPTGAVLKTSDLERLSRLVLERDLFVLCDEAYFHMRYEGKPTSLGSLPDMAERCLLLHTFSKRFAMTGWRLGTAIGPEPLVEALAKLNVNDESCTNHFIQHAAIEALTGDPSGPENILRTLKERRDAAVALLDGIEGVRCLKPRATFYLFVNVTETMRRKGMSDLETFRTEALQATGVSFCTRRHFGPPLEGESQYYIRLAYSGIDVADIEEGLQKLKDFAER